MKYQINDRVLIKPDLEEGKFYSNEDNPDIRYGVNDIMAGHAGEIATIIEVGDSSYDDGSYHIDLCPVWCWTDGMFEEVVESSMQSVDIPEDLL